jgi:hypothetical protein
MDPILYILMRSDLQDNNPGKMMAQAAHVASSFEMWTRAISCQPDQYSELIHHIQNWRSGAGSCGTTICLEATKNQILETRDLTTFSDVFTDPTYPWRNYYGDVFVSSELTGGWVFVCDENAPELERLKSFKLHR